MNKLDLTDIEVDNILLALSQYVELLRTGEDVLTEDEFLEVQVHIDILETSFFKLKQLTGTPRCLN